MTSERFKFIGSSYLFLIKENEILLQRRFQTGFEDGNYGVPAGHLDGNETTREGCAREMKEELGIEIRLEDIDIVHVMQRKATQDERFDFFMKAIKYTGEIENKEPNKCDDLRWFPIDNLPANTIDYVRTAIENYKKGVFYSEYNY